MTRAPLDNQHYWTPASFRYRCYKIVYDFSKGSFRCTNTFSRLLYEIPAAFTWTRARDRDGLCAYIDLLCQGRTTEAEYFEQQGVVTDVEEGERPDPDQVVVLRVEELLETLALRSEWRVPLALKLRFVVHSKERSILPAEFTTNLLQHTQVEGWSDLTDLKHAKVAREDDLRSRMGLRFGDLHTGANLDRAQWPARVPGQAPEVDPAPWVDADDDDPSPVPQETEVSRVVSPTHVEVVTRVVQAGADPYFVRRVISEKGALLYEATSYQATGPWKVWTRDNAGLLARRVRP